MSFPFRRRFFWDWDIEDEIRRIEQEFDEMLSSITEIDKYVKEFLKESDKKDKEFIVKGPFVYGISIKFGKDGVPIIRKFGNVNIKDILKESEETKIEDFVYQREPLVDIVEDNNNITIIAEVPGVEKNDIKLTTTEKILTIDVDTEKRKYHKTINLPSEIIPETAKASYKNGILEIKAEKKKKEETKGGVNIKIE